MSCGDLSQRNECAGSVLTVLFIKNEVWFVIRMIFTRDHRIPGLALTEFRYRLMPTGLQIQSGISCFCKVEAERLD